MSSDDYLKNPFNDDGFLDPDEDQEIPSLRDELDELEDEVSDGSDAESPEDPLPGELNATGMWETLNKLDRDLRASASLLGQDAARYLVDSYYQIQNFRIRLNAQAKASEDAGESNVLLKWFFENVSRLEKNIQRALGEFAQTYTVGRWMNGITGIGPVLSAGFLAHIDIRRSSPVGALWSFAGLNPTRKWLGVKGARELLHTVETGEGVEEALERMGPDPTAFTPEQIESIKAAIGNESKFPLTMRQIELVSQITGRKFHHILAQAQNVSKSKRGTVTRDNLLRALARRPWNARLKVLCWKTGESFIKNEDKKGDYYGVIYRVRKDQEVAKNRAGEFSEQARQKLKDVNYGAETDAYAWLSGQLSQADHDVYYSTPTKERLGLTRRLVIARHGGKDFVKDQKHAEKLGKQLERAQTVLQRHNDRIAKLEAALEKARSGPAKEKKEAALDNLKSELPGLQGAIGGLQQAYNEAQGVVQTQKKALEGLPPGVQMLPPGQIHSRARRYAVKWFLSHLHDVMYWDLYGKQPPLPYAFEHMEGHKHYVAPPNWPNKNTAKNLSELLRNPLRG